MPTTPEKPKRDWLTRPDVIIILIAAALALFAFSVIGFMRINRDYSDRVDIFVDGKLYKSAYLGAEDRITIERDGMKNVLRLTEDGFFMEYSSCKNQLCVQQGAVTNENSASRALGAHIICLPNRIDARLESASDAPDA